MKPCAQHRKSIVWLTLHQLEASQARELRAHLETCEGCRCYLAEISNVTERLAAPEANPGVEASAIFHQKLAGRLRAAKSDSRVEILAVNFRENHLKWRAALAVLAALVVLDVSVVLWRRPPAASSFPRTVCSSAPASAADNDLAPTVANYERVADQSLDALDALLTRQGNRASPPTPVYTDSTLALGDESF
jgi:hypothetical protein